MPDDEEGEWFILIIFFILLIIFVGLAIFKYSSSSGNIGSTCTAGSGCTAGSVCDSTTGTCRMPIGGRCTLNTDCVNGSSCVGRVCVANVVQSTTTNTTTTTPTTPPTTTTTMPLVPLVPVNQNPTTTTTTNENTEDMMEVFQHGRSSTGKVMSDGITIIIDDCKVIKSNIAISRVELCNNTLYAISFGELYSVNMNDTRCDRWKWSKCGFHNKRGVKHISATYDRKHLWIQSDSEGYLYEDECLIGKTATYMLRNYGRTKNDYVEFCVDKCIVKHEGDQSDGICYAVLDMEGEIHGIEKCHFGTVSRAKIVNGKMYHIYRDCDKTNRSVIF